MTEPLTSQPATLVHPAEFPELAPAGIDSPARGLDFIKDIPVRVTAELGHTQIPIRELMKLGAGAVVELKRAVGEPVDLRVNGRLLAQGEVVVINDNFAIRLTSVLQPGELLP